MAQEDKVGFAEELVRKAPGLSAEELVEGRVFIGREKPTKEKVVSKKKKVVSKKLVKEFKKLPRPQFDVTYSREQQMLRSMFGGGIGKNVLLMEHERMPQINGILRSGHGLIKSDDPFHETASLMGFHNQGGFFVKPRNVQQKQRRNFRKTPFGF